MNDGKLEVVIGPWGGPSITMSYGCKVLEGKEQCPSHFHWAHNHLQDVLLNLSKEEAKFLVKEITRLLK